MSIMAYNGGCVVAMKGKDCVAVATDHRFGIQASLNYFVHQSCILIKFITILGSNNCYQFRESISSEQVHVLRSCWASIRYPHSFQAINVSQKFI